MSEDKNTIFFSPVITLSTVWERYEGVLKLYINNSGDVIEQFENFSLNFHSIPEGYRMRIYLIETAYELTIINSYNVYAIKLDRNYLNRISGTKSSSAKLKQTK